MAITPEAHLANMPAAALEAAVVLERMDNGRLAAAVYYLVAENERLRASTVVTVSSPASTGVPVDVSAGQEGEGVADDMVTTVGDDTQVTTLPTADTGSAT
jgi:hypothetical protein